VKILLDTHALYWWFGDSSRLSKPALSILSDSRNVVLISAATAWEMAIKVNLGKLNALDLVLELSKNLAEEGFEQAPIGCDTAVRAGLLPLHHRDPFDRLLVAQAQELNVPILSSDPLLDRYDVKRLW
jgi:PIN domain nuclease of toxin-antitoxin system